jgi:hypothetical protein
MKGSFVNNNDRNTMITMFIVAYVICILCAIIPLYAIFGLPEKAKEVAYFKLDKKTDNTQKEVLLRFDSLVNTLDSLLKASNPESSTYTATALYMRILTDDQKKARNPYYPVFLNVANLYDQIKGYCENSKKVDNLTKENTTLLKELDELKKEFEDLKDEKVKLEFQLEKAK